MGELASERVMEGGRERGRQGRREEEGEEGRYVDIRVPKNDHFVNVMVSLGRVLTTQFD